MDLKLRFAQELLHRIVYVLSRPPQNWIFISCFFFSLFQLSRCFLTFILINLCSPYFNTENSEWGKLYIFLILFLNNMFRSCLCLINRSFLQVPSLAKVTLCFIPFACTCTGEAKCKNWTKEEKKKRNIFMWKKPFHKFYERL